MRNNKSHGEILLNMKGIISMIKKDCIFMVKDDHNDFMCGILNKVYCSCESKDCSFYKSKKEYETYKEGKNNFIRKKTRT